MSCPATVGGFSVSRIGNHCYFALTSFMSNTNLNKVCKDIDSDFQCLLHTAVSSADMDSKALFTTFNKYQVWIPVQLQTNRQWKAEYIHTDIIGGGNLIILFLILFYKKFHKRLETKNLAAVH